MITAMYSAILEHLNTGWAFATPIHFPNSKQPVAAPYIRATFLPVGSTQAEIGENGMARHDGIFVIDVFVEVDSGIGGAATYMDDLIALFTRGTQVTKSGLTATFAEPEPLAGRDDGHGYFQVQIHCPWYVFYTN